MAWNVGTLQLLEDPRQEFADKTGCILTGLNFRPTITGWQLLVKRVNREREKEVCFIDSWTVKGCLELFYDGIVMPGSSLVWKPDKF